MIRRIGVKDGSLLILKLQMGVKRMMLKRIILIIGIGYNVSGPLLVSRTGDVGCSNRQDKMLK